MKDQGFEKIDHDQEGADVFLDMVETRRSSFDEGTLDAVRDYFLSPSYGTEEPEKCIQASERPWFELKPSIIEDVGSNEYGCVKYPCSD